MNFQYEDIILVPIIIAISEGLKKASFPVKLIPLVNILLGVVSGVFLVSPQDRVYGIIQGIIVGLTASGLYSSSKNVYEGYKESY